MNTPETPLNVSAPALTQADAARLQKIGDHLRTALALADEGGDALLGVKLHTCIEHVEEALAAV